MSELFDKNSVINEIIRKLHAGVEVNELSKKFGEVIKTLTPSEILQIEEELIKEGASREEIQKLCDLHLTLFKNTLERAQILVPEGHSIHILMEEHKALLELAEKLRAVTNKIKEAKGFDGIEEDIKYLEYIARHFKESESHYLREENVLFPYLEKHGITQPPAIMWAEHDKIRDIKKIFYRVIHTHKEASFQNFRKQLVEVVISLSEMLTSHFYKENTILFPTALKVIDEKTWSDIKMQFDELGYCCFTPESAKTIIRDKEKQTHSSGTEDTLSFKTGTLPKEEMEAILNTLPVDITFVDKEDTVVYFNSSQERIFPRTRAVLGRKVQQCHPQKSIHIVNQILEDFKNHRKDIAEFWIDLKGRLIYIRYFAVRGQSGGYLGCMEVTQDITEIKKIEVEKKLL